VRLNIEGRLHLLRYRVAHDAPLLRRNSVPGVLSLTRHLIDLLTVTAAGTVEITVCEVRPD